MEIKTILITGATSGIGLAGATEMSRLGWKVLLHARSQSSGQIAMDMIKSLHSQANIQLVTGDLSSKAGVLALAKSVLAQCTKLDVLWNNAGMIATERHTNADGWELQMSVNHLAPFILTTELLPLIQAKGGGRVISTASGAQAWANIDFNNWMDEGKRYKPMGIYSKSKLCNVLFTRELAERFGGTGIVAHCFHPGFVRSEISKSRETNRYNPLFSIISFLTISPAAGADTGVFLATNDSALNSNGKYWAKRHLRSTNKLDTPANAKLLWELTEKAIRL